MSWQIAMMAGQAALSSAQAVSSGIKAGAAAKASAEEGIMGAHIRAAQGRAAAAGTGVEIAETHLATGQQEVARRRQIAQLWQANAIDLVGRGGVSGDQGSADVIQAYNAKLGEEDVSNIRFMSESRVSKLSFRQTQQLLGAQAQDLSALNIGDNLTRQMDKIASDTTFKILGNMMGMGSSMTANSGSKDPRDVYTGDQTGGLA